MKRIDAQRPPAVRHQTSRLATDVTMGRLRLWLLRATVSGVSAYAALLAAQASLPVIFGVPVRVPFDTPFVRSSLEIAEGLRATHPDVTVLVYPSLWTDRDLPDGSPLFPLAGLPRRLTTFCEEQPQAAVTMRCSFAISRRVFRSS